MRSVSGAISARYLENTTIFDVIGDIDLANSPVVRKALLVELREKKTSPRHYESSGRQNILTAPALLRLWKV